MAKDCPNNLQELFRELNPEKPEIFDKEWVAQASFSPPPFMVYLILVQCLGCTPIYQPREKMAWITYFSFQDKPMFAAHLKLGLQLAVQGPDSNELLTDFQKLLHNALPLANELFDDLVRTTLSNGQVTIENKSFLFKERYLFLRKQAEQKFKDQTFLSHREGFFLASASLDAYFSLLEHYLVLLLPFVNFDPSQGNILKVVRGTWEKNFQKIFGEPPANKAERIVEKLKQVKRRWRNALAHGGFDYEGLTFFVQIPGLGAIPASLAKDERLFQFSNLPISHSDFKDICTTLDECDHLMKNGNLKQAFQYIDAGLNLYFDETGQRELKAALDCEESMKDLIEQQAYLEDMYTNMDW